MLNSNQQPLFEAQLVYEVYDVIIKCQLLVLLWWCQWGSFMSVLSICMFPVSLATSILWVYWVNLQPQWL